MIRTYHIVTINREGEVRVAGDRYEAEPISFVGEDCNHSEGNSGATDIATHSVNQRCICCGDKSR